MLMNHDDSVTLLTVDDGDQEQAQGCEQPTAQTTWKEIPNMPKLKKDYKMLDQCVVLSNRL